MGTIIIDTFIARPPEQVFTYLRDYAIEAKWQSEHVFELVESNTSTTGVIIANYKRAGEVKIGRFITEPTEAELERRKRLAREDIDIGKT